ncbi:MAG: Ig-like domain-containing protein [Longimicrobiales bacterium]|nr:Ig-like domain-containing protein [Longimicrobiales bacterium]
METAGGRRRRTRARQRSTAEAATTRRLARMLCFTVALAACDPTTGPEEQQEEQSVVASVSVSPEVATIVPGQRQQFTATAHDGDGREIPGISFTWSSSDPTIASVDDNGLATGVTDGTVQVSADVGDQGPTGSATLVVEPEARFSGSWRSISTGASHTCALDGEGRAFCWGDNSNGELGTGEWAFEDQPTAQPVRGGLQFAAISTGANTCAVAPDGAAYCWGSNANGELGTSSSESCRGGDPCSTVPIPIADPEGGPVTWRSVSVGWRHACGLSTSGNVYCWGHNGECQLGDCALAEAHRPVLVADADSAGMAVSMRGRVQAVSTRGSHTCAVLTGNALVCWGTNSDGELAAGGFSENESPIMTAIGPDDVVVGGMLGASGHTCVLVGGRGFCAGSGLDGRLGNGGDTYDEPSFVPVEGGLTWSSLTAGDSHTCGVTSDDVPYCWGDNYYGAVGNGTSGILYDETVPVPVGTNDAYAVLSAGLQYSCGITTDGRAFCWGDNLYGQLGDGTSVQRDLPVRVKDPA